MSESIDEILLLPQRKLMVSRNDIHLDNVQAANEIFILVVEESRGSAGGRAAGSGHRRVIKIYGFSCESGKCSKFFETEDQTVIERFDIPYSAVAMDIRLSDGRSHVVQGVVDPETVESYHAVMRNLK